MQTKIEAIAVLVGPAAAEAGKPLNFGCSLSLYQKRNVMVPLGVPDVKHKASNPYFQFKYSIKHQAAQALTFEVRGSNGQLYFHMDLAECYKEPGDYLISWDGFDSKGVFDSQRIIDQTLSVCLIAVWPAGRESPEVSFRASSHKASWLDVRISRPDKRIDVILRTNFKDGGEGKLSSQAKPDQPLRSKSFEALLLLAKKGLHDHWSRAIVLPDGETYNLFLEAVNMPERAIKTPKIVYQSNARVRRSRNWELSRILFYHTGQLLRAGKWYHKSEGQADVEFKQIAAHEIGHEILLAYGGHLYSKSHKGSSTLITQRPLGNYLYPATGEIDLMVYYSSDSKHPFPGDFHKRNIASESDVRSLLWIAQIAYELI